MVPRSLEPFRRAFDLLGAVFGLLLFGPLLGLVGLLVLLTLGRPVFFRQVRIGHQGRPFRPLKFRTMTGSRDGSGRLRPDALRLDWFGRLLRSTSVDELPQLWNVLRGEMSLVGPRPLLPEYLERYSPEQARRHEVKPGLTGWAQVNGRNAVTWDERLRQDVWYVDNRGFGLDLRILGLTLLRVLQQRGISARGCATMPEFLGSGAGTGEMNRG